MPETMQNMSRWGPRDHPLEKCVEKSQVRIAGKPATCGYSDSIPFADFLRTKKPLTFPASGHPRGGGVHFSIEWALGGMGAFIFSSNGRSGEWGRSFSDG